MKNNRLLTPVTILAVTLAHIGILVMAWHGTPPESQSNSTTLTFVDLGSIYGDDQPMADGAPAPLEAPPTPPAEPPKPEPKKPEPKKPEPKPKPKPQKIKAVQRDDRPADIVQSEPEKPKEIKPEPPKPVAQETPITPTNTTPAPVVTNPQHRSADGVAGGGGGTDPNSKRPGNPASPHKGGDGMGAKGSSTDIVDGGTVHIATPPYPARARENGEEGVVRIEIIVEPNGTVSSAKIVRRSGSRALDNAALNAAKNARVTPKKVNGVPVRSRYIAPFRFQLN